MSLAEGVYSPQASPANTARSPGFCLTAVEQHLGEAVRLLQTEILGLLIEDREEHATC